MSPRGPGEAARLTQEIINTTGMSRADVGRILGRNPSLVSQFFTTGKGGSMVAALRTIRAAVDAGERDIETLNSLAAPHMTRRQNAKGRTARTRVADTVTTRQGSTRARAGKQHLASGGSRLAPGIEQAAARGGRISLTTRARPGAYPPDDEEYPRYDKAIQPDGSEERRWGNRGQGFDAREFQQRIDAHHGDVSSAVHAWMVDNGHLRPGATLTHLEVRTWGG